MHRNNVGVTAVARSANGKVGPVRVTHVAQGSCPPDCVFLGNGDCYANNGPQAWTTNRLNRAPLRTPEEYARSEAELVRKLPAKGVPLRLHIVGDARTPAAARILADAAADYRARGGGPVWKYTHAWRDVPRNAWGAMSILASVHSVADAAAALEAGYAPALTVPKHASPKAYAIGGGIRGIPCPAQRGDTTCNDCRLCMRADTLQAQRAAILFEPDNAKSSATILRASQ